MYGLPPVGEFGARLALPERVLMAGCDSSFW